MDTRAAPLMKNGLLLEEMLMGVGLAYSLVAENSSKSHRHGRRIRHMMILRGTVELAKLCFPADIWRTSYGVAALGGVPSLTVRISAGWYPADSAHARACPRARFLPLQEDWLKAKWNVLPLSIFIEDGGNRNSGFDVKGPSSIYFWR